MVPLEQIRRVVSKDGWLGKDMSGLDRDMSLCGQGGEQTKDDVWRTNGRMLAVFSNFMKLAACCCT